MPRQGGTGRRAAGCAHLPTRIAGHACGGAATEAQSEDQQTHRRLPLSFAGPGRTLHRRHELTRGPRRRRRRAGGGVDPARPACAAPAAAGPPAPTPAPPPCRRAGRRERARPTGDDTLPIPPVPPRIAEGARLRDLPGHAGHRPQRRGRDGHQPGVRRQGEAARIATRWPRWSSATPRPAPPCWTGWPPPAARPPPRAPRCSPRPDQAWTMAGQADQAYASATPRAGALPGRSRAADRPRHRRPGRAALRRGRRRPDPRAWNSTPNAPTP